MANIPKYHGRIRIPKYRRPQVSVYVDDLSSRRWQLYRERFIALNPICRPCQEKGDIHASEQVDHVIPLAAGGAVWNPKNHDPVCARYNAWKGSQVLEPMEMVDSEWLPVNQRMNKL